MVSVRRKGYGDTSNVGSPPLSFDKPHSSPRFTVPPFDSPVPSLHNPKQTNYGNLSRRSLRNYPVPPGSNGDSPCVDETLGVGVARARVRVCV